MDEFQQAFKVMKECTSSSPAGINYTFWKSIAHDHHLSSLFVIMMHLLFMYGFKNTCWANYINIMLERKLAHARYTSCKLLALSRLNSTQP